MNTRTPGTSGNVKRWLIIGFGFIVLILGVIMIFLPGPGVLFILLGLGILARELRWARTFLIRIRNYIRRMTHKKQPASQQPPNPPANELH